jgi:CheY-like chemotaxis protein
MSHCARRTRTPARANGHVLSRKRSASKPKVLVVEDHEDTRQMLRTMLEMSGCRVVIAGNGLEAVAVARREQPTLILMDGSLPVLDGLGATRLIRREALLRNVLIVALNGWGTPSYHAAALAAGCDDCLEKPIDFDRLEYHLARLSAAPALLPTSDHRANSRL